MRVWPRSRELNQQARRVRDWLLAEGGREMRDNDNGWPQIETDSDSVGSMEKKKQEGYF